VLIKPHQILLTIFFSDMFSRLNRPFNLTAENTVEKSLINLRQRHLECHKTILEINAKKKSLIEQTDKHLLTLRSSLNDQPISKDLIIYLVQLSQMKVAAESMLINIVSKLGSLNVIELSNIFTNFQQKCS